MVRRAARHVTAPRHCATTRGATLLDHRPHRGGCHYCCWKLAPRLIGPQAAFSPPLLFYRSSHANSSIIRAGGWSTIRMLRLWVQFLNPEPSSPRQAALNQRLARAALEEDAEESEPRKPAATGKPAAPLGKPVAKGDFENGEAAKMGQLSSSGGGKVGAAAGRKSGATRAGGGDSAAAAARTSSSNIGKARKADIATPALLSAEEGAAGGGGTGGSSSAGLAGGAAAPAVAAEEQVATQQQQRSGGGGWGLLAPAAYEELRLQYK